MMAGLNRGGVFDLTLLLSNYDWLIYAVGAMALLMIVQLLVADLVGLSRKHMPGTPVNADHGNLHFRSVRALGNTNESIAIFVLLVLFNLFVGADAGLAGAAAWGFVLGRAGHMACYYANIQLVRSGFFGLSLIALIAMLVIGLTAVI